MKQKLIIFFFCCFILANSQTHSNETCDENNGIFNYKKILILGETGVGKSTLGNAISKKNVFAASYSKDSVTKNFQSYKFMQGCNNEIEIIDSPGFTDVEKSNLTILNSISKKIKDEQIDYIVIVLKYGVRQTNQDFILKWLKYCLPLNLSNSHVLINYVFETVDVDFEIDEENQVNQVEEENMSFIDYIKGIFVSSSFSQISSLNNKSAMIKEFSTLARQIISKTFSSKIDHGQVFTLTQKLQREEVNVQLKCIEDLRPEYIDKFTNDMINVKETLNKIEKGIIDLENELQQTQKLANQREIQAKIAERDNVLQDYFNHLSKMFENLLSIIQNPLNLISYIKDLGGIFKTNKEVKKEGKNDVKNQQQPEEKEVRRERTVDHIKFDIDKSKQLMSDIKFSFSKMEIEQRNLDKVIKEGQKFKQCFEQNETLIDLQKVIKYFNSLKN